MAEMKDSGIEWCGKIPISWNVMPNKYVMHKKKEICPKYNGEDILSLTMDGVIVRDLDAGGKMPASFDGYQRVHPHNLLMCLFDYDVTPRCIGLIQNEGLTSPAYSQFVMKNGNDARYYYYYYLMIDNTKELLHLAKNLRHSFTEDQLGIINTPVPPVEIQKKIAKYLDQKCEDIDAVYVEIEKQIETLEEYKKSIITEAVTKGLDPDAEMKDSGIEWIGKMPKNWEIKKIKYVTKSINDIEHYMPNDSEDTDKVPYLMIGDLKDKISDVDFEKCKHISRKDYKVLSIKGKNNKGDVIFARYATIGTVMYIDENLDFLVSYACLTIKPQNNIYGKFLFYYFKSKAFFEDVNQYINTNTQGNIGKESLSKTKIAVPSIRKQQQIVKYLDIKCAEIDGVIVDKKKQLETLEQYKKSLIYEYVTGKKEVPDYE